MGRGRLPADRLAVGRHPGFAGQGSARFFSGDPEQDRSSVDRFFYLLRQPGGWRSYLFVIAGPAHGPGLQRAGTGRAGSPLRAVGGQFRDCRSPGYMVAVFPRDHLHQAGSMVIGSDTVFLPVLR